VPALAVVVALIVSAPTPARAALETFLVAFALFGILLRWFAAVLLDFTELGGLLAAGAVIASAAVLGLMTATLGASAVALRPKVGELATAGIVASGWVGLEVVRGVVPFPFPWGTLSAAHANAPFAAPIARLVGAHGLGLLAACAAAALALAASRRRGGLPALAVVAALVAVAWLAGASVGGGDDAPTVRAAVVQASASRDAAAADELVAYEALTREAARGGARLVVWPESAVSYRIDGRAWYRARVEGLARALGVDIVLTSVTTDDEGRLYNSAALVRADTGMAGLAPKRQLVPFGEYLPLRFLLGSMPAIAAEAGDFTPGGEARVLPARQGTIGALVCYESIFPGSSLDLVAAGADVLTVMTNDSWFGWTSGPEQHLEHGRLRAAEAGAPLLRAAHSGLSVIVDRRGRELGRLELGGRGVLVADVRPGGDAPGLHVGAWIGRACATLLIAAWIAALLRQFVPARRPFAAPRARPESARPEYEETWDA
jgi:apolipoprotein N-acyltransferase